MSRPAWQHLIAIFGGLLAALACGWITDRPGLCASLYLAAIVAWQARNLIRFEHWLRLRKIMEINQRKERVLMLLFISRLLISRRCLFLNKPKSKILFS